MLQRHYLQSVRSDFLFLHSSLLEGGVFLEIYPFFWVVVNQFLNIAQDLRREVNWQRLTRESDEEARIKAGGCSAKHQTSHRKPVRQAHRAECSAPASSHASLAVTAGSRRLCP